MERVCIRRLKGGNSSSLLTYPAAAGPRQSVIGHSIGPICGSLLGLIALSPCWLVNAYQHWLFQGWMYGDHVSYHSMRCCPYTMLMSGLANVTVLHTLQ